jgi:hypothetical protein
MTVQPLADVLVLMGCVVIQDQVNRQVFGYLAVDGLEEFQPLLMPVGVAYIARSPCRLTSTLGAEIESSIGDRSPGQPLDESRLVCREI